MSRFGDVAANDFVINLFEGIPSIRHTPIMIKSFFASNIAACWRIFLMPFDTLKTTLQVEGKEGVNQLMESKRRHGFRIFYNGGAGAYLSCLVGHGPWFFTFNFLNENMGTPVEPLQK